MPELSAAEFVKTSCYVVLFSFGWRLLAGRYHDAPLGRAMASIFS